MRVGHRQPFKICVQNTDYYLLNLPIQKASRKDCEKHLQDLQDDTWKILKDLSSKKAWLEELTLTADKARDEHIKVQDKLENTKKEYDLMKQEWDKLKNDGECDLWH